MRELSKIAELWEATSVDMRRHSLAMSSVLDLIAAGKLGDTSRDDLRDLQRQIERMRNNAIALEQDLKSCAAKLALIDEVAG